MKIEIFDVVAKALRNESKEVNKDLYDILGKLRNGIKLGLPHVE